MTTEIKEPTQRQLESVASHIKDTLLHNWDIDSIACGVKRVKANDEGIVSEVFISQGLFATLCHLKFGDRTRRAFDLGGYRVKSWRPKT